ncbi:hypothetical protein GCM10017752_47610 [Streptomyces roseoviridis]
MRGTSVRLSPLCSVKAGAQVQALAPRTPSGVHSVYLVVDPYAAEVVVHTQPTGTGYIAAHTHKYGTGELPIDLADGRTFTLDLDGLPRPEPATGAR